MACQYSIVINQLESVLFQQGYGIYLGICIYSPLALVVAKIEFGHTGKRYVIDPNPILFSVKDLWNLKEKFCLCLILYDFDRKEWDQFFPQQIIFRNHSKKKGKQKKGHILLKIDFSYVLNFSFFAFPNFSYVVFFLYFSGK